MSREVRMVPPNWQHPTEWRKDHITNRPKIAFKPLMSGLYAELAARWDEEAAQWDLGFIDDWKGGWKPKEQNHTGSYADYCGPRPLEDQYMPVFAAGTATYLMMYETTTEGTPISPAFATPEELAHWLADNNASAFGTEGATYEQWLRVCRGGYAPSAVRIGDGPLMSGVAGITDLAPGGTE